jgi:hypothetical protein
MKFFGGEKAIRKRDFPAAIIRKEFIWIIVAVSLPVLGIATLYLFVNYTSYTGALYAPVIITAQIIYSVYLIWSVHTEGIKLNASKMKKYKSNQFLYVSRMINRTQLNRYYTGLFLYFLLMVYIVFSTI